MRPYVVFSCRLIAATAIWSIFEMANFKVLFRNPRTGVIENTRTRYQGPLNSNFDRLGGRGELEFAGSMFVRGRFGFVHQCATGSNAFISSSIACGKRTLFSR